MRKRGWGSGRLCAGPRLPGTLPKSPAAALQKAAIVTSFGKEPRVLARDGTTSGKPSAPAAQIWLQEEPGCGPRGYAARPS